MMKDGYYLSAYVHINELGFLISDRKGAFYRHDHNLSLWRKTGETVTLVHYWELERLTGLKEHCVSFYDKVHAVNFINGLLEEYDLTLHDMVEVWGTPLLSTNDSFHAIEDFPDAAYHNVAHLFSAVLSDTTVFQDGNIIGLSMDAGPDFVLEMTRGPIDLSKHFFSGCVTVNGKVEGVFPVSSPGYLWGRASNTYHLKEGTLMALAGACTCELFGDHTEELVINNWETSFQVNSRANQYVDSLVRRVAGLTPADAGVLFSGYDSRFTEEENKISMVMKVVQNTSILIIEKEIERILGKYGMNPENTYLAMSGGYALNCPTNSYLMKKYHFKGFLAPPCVNDSGMSMGIALYAFHKSMGKFHFKLAHSYFGNASPLVEQALGSDKYHPFIESAEPLSLEQAVQDIIEGPIVWFNGRSEVGPRALGNRSILADPRKEWSKSLLNQIKQREWWRPVAPIVLEEAAGEWFEDVYPSPYMLHTFRIKDDKADQIPAVSHLDTSARVQTVTREDNGAVFELLKQFRQETGVPILCNTSLNDRGEPIIDRPEEALNFGLRKGIQVVYLHGIRVRLQRHGEFKDQEPGGRKSDFLSYISPDEKDRILEELNAENMPLDLLSTYSPELYNSMLADPEGHSKVWNKLVKTVRKSKNYKSSPGGTGRW